MNTKRFLLLFVFNVFAIGAFLFSCGKQDSKSPNEAAPLPVATEPPTQPVPTLTATATVAPTPTVTVAPTAPTVAPIFSPSTGTKSQSGLYLAKVTFDVGPQAGAESVLTVSFAHLDGTPVNKIQNESFKPWMTVHGHGVPSGRLKVSQFGNYQIKVTGLYFTMSGPWDLLVDVDVEDGGRESFVLPVQVP